MIKILLRFYEDSLFRNSFYLMLATGIAAAFGFVFWLIGARLASIPNIGLATTLVSSMVTISVLGLVGFDTSIVRYLAHALDRNSNITTSAFVVIGSSLVLATSFVVLVGVISPELGGLMRDPLAASAFVVFCVMSALNLFAGAVFLAYRDTKYTLMASVVSSSAKIPFVFMLAPWGAFGIFSAVAIAQLLGAAFSVAMLIIKFEYRPRWMFELEVVRRVRLYSTGNYVADILGFVPLGALPVIVTNNLGPTEAAYFNVVMLIGGLLYAIPHSVTRMFFAHGSFDDAQTMGYVRKTVQTIALFLLPAILVLLVFGRLILTMFGEAYAAGGANFLYVIALSGVVVGISSVYGSLFRVTRNIAALIARNGVSGVALIGLTYALLPWGLVGVGIALVCSALLEIGVGHIMYRLESRGSVVYNFVA